MVYSVCTVQWRLKDARKHRLHVRGDKYAVVAAGRRASWLLSKRGHFWEPEDPPAALALRAAALWARAAKLPLETPPPEDRA